MTLEKSIRLDMWWTYVFNEKSRHVIWQIWSHIFLFLKNLSVSCMWLCYPNMPTQNIKIIANKYRTFLLSLLCSKHHMKCFLIISSTLNYTLKQIFLLSPFYRWGNWGLKICQRLHSHSGHLSSNGQVVCLILSVILQYWPDHDLLTSFRSAEESLLDKIACGFRKFLLKL